MKPAAKIIIAFLSVIIILVIWWLFPSLSPPIKRLKKNRFKEGKKVVFVCPSGNNVEAAFGSAKVITVKSLKTKGMKLHRTRSADGERYANTSESFVLWDKGIYAMITHNDTTETCINKGYLDQVKANKREIKKVIIGFGSRLQRVSLLAPKASETISQVYAPYVTPQLLSKWEQDLSSVPGRTTSSPWPDHFVINRIQPTGVLYSVDATLILMTSNEIEHGGNFGTKEVEMTVVKRNGKWRISSYIVKKYPIHK
jgi:membrane-bound inhibitor of C-type lysozyme